MPHDPVAGRRIVPPAVMGSVPPPPMAAHVEPSAPKRNASPRMLVRLTLLFIIVCGLLAGGLMFLRAYKLEREVQRLTDEMALAHLDSIKATSWQGKTNVADGYYLLMSVHDGNAFAEDFLRTLSTPAQIMVFWIDNRAGNSSHTLDTTNATLRMRNGTTRPVPDANAVLRSCAANVEAVLRAFPPVIDVPPGDYSRGRVIIVPADLKFEELAEVTVNLDGQPFRIEGEFLTAQVKQARGIEDMMQRRK